MSLWKPDAIAIFVYGPAKITLLGLMETISKIQEVEIVVAIPIPNADNAVTHTMAA